MKTISIRRIGLMAACALALGACNRSADTPASNTTAPAPTPTAAAPRAPAEPQAAVTPAATAPAATSVDNTSEGAGEQAVNDAIDRVLGDHARYREVFARLQQAVAAGDAPAVAALVAYPFTTRIDGRQVKLEDAAAFAAHYDRIVTPAVADAIARQKYADVMVSAKGVMLGNGEAWLNGVCRDRACARPEVKVIAIQPGPR